MLGEDIGTRPDAVGPQELAERSTTRLHARGLGTTKPGDVRHAHERRLTHRDRPSGAWWRGPARAPTRRPLDQRGRRLGAPGYTMGPARRCGMSVAPAADRRVAPEAGAPDPTLGDRLLERPG